jgi:hypothetical protein
MNIGAIPRDKSQVEIEVMISLFSIVQDREGKFKCVWNYCSLDMTTISTSSSKPKIESPYTLGNPRRFHNPAVFTAGTCEVISSQHPTFTVCRTPDNFRLGDPHAVAYLGSHGQEQMVQMAQVAGFISYTREHTVLNRSHANPYYEKLIHTARMPTKKQLS